MTNKPLCLELEEANNELNKAIEDISNRHGLPCYLLTSIVSDLLARLENGKRRELEEAKISYENSLKEETTDV